MIQIITKIRHYPGLLEADIMPQHETAVAELVRKIGPGMAKIQLVKWYRHRTTGWKSQNHHINAHIQQIAVETGNDFDTVKVYMKQQAVGRGYPYDLLNDVMIPWSETRIDTLQASYLIDEIHQFAAEYGINLTEE